MHTRSTIIALMMALTLTLPLSGCGDNDNNNNTNDNTSGKPTRTPTPVRTATVVAPTATPVSATSTPVVSGEPTPTETATEVVNATATPTSGATSPTATATPGGGGDLCATGEHIMVTASLDKPFTAFGTTLSYPTDSVNIPNSGTMIGNRVTFIVTGGLSSSADLDDIGDDGVDDTVHAAFVSQDSQNAGQVFTVTFDCIAGQQKPTASAFTCTVTSASDASGNDPGETCTVQVR